MKYRCLVFDHDDTVVNSTATIHHPCFREFLKEYYPGRDISLEEYFIRNFTPGFVEMCRREYGMDDAMLVYKVYGNYKIASDGFADVAAEMRENAMVLITCEDESAEGGYLNRRVILAEPLQDPTN